MTSSQGKFEKSLIYNNLVCVVKGIEGRYTTIDLRNESCLTGKIESVDGFMNIELVDVLLYDNRGNIHKFDTFFVHKRNIRYVHIPKSLDAKELCEKAFDSITRKPVREPMRKTYKIKRAENYQKSILKEITN